MQSGTMHRQGLLRFHVVSLWGFVAACLVQLAYPARQNDYPCPDASAIQWVRHRDDCGRYYICHFGQPLVMPRCPRDQVWSNAAKNCVPEGSRWDDCSGHAPALTTIQRYGHSRSPYATGAPPATTARFPHTTVNPARHRPTPVKTPAPTTPSWHAREKENKVEDKWTVIDHPKKALVKPKEKPAKTPTLEPEFKSTKTEGKQRKSPYPPPTPRTYITTRRPRTTISPRRSTHAIVVMPTTVAVTVPAPSRTTAQRAHHAPTPATPRTVTPSHPATTPRRAQPTLRVTQRAHYDAPTTLPTPRITHRRDTYPPLKMTLPATQPAPTTTTPQPTPSTPAWMNIPPDHPCRATNEMVLPHPKNCHWFYNCSLMHPESRWLENEPFTDECRYPQLFDVITMKCREFVNVNCRDKFEPVDPCEYTHNKCASSSCIPCHNRYGSCRGKANGIYPFHVDRWSPTFITCYNQRNIAQDECQEPTPIFSPRTMDCVSQFEVPKIHGGLGPDCSFRSDGFYPDEQGRCAIFFECRDNEFVGFDECPAGKVFDPLTLRCQEEALAVPPCGRAQEPRCENRADGYHADPFGRCTYYFECRQGRFVKYLTCDFGSFDPVHQRCVIPTELIPKPCGLLPNPCENKASGFYPNTNSGCKDYIECSRGVLVSNGTCPAGKVFSVLSGRCDQPEHAPPPCGQAPSCEHQKDGKYPALLRGCSHFYECRNKVFQGFKQCTQKDGGFFFNPKIGECDVPQNICPPCGYRWWGCSRSSLLS